MEILPQTAAVEDGRLSVGGVDLEALAREYGTPLYVYDAATLGARARAYVDALQAYPGTARAVFACKANATVAVLREVLAQGLGADAASAGELAAALAAGAAADTLVIHGNNKSDDDLRAAVEARAGLVVVDHPGEIAQLDAIAAAAGIVQRVLVRVTPGITADTHRKIVTGHSDSKFGFAPPDALAALAAIGARPHLGAAGLHVHLGSQISDLDTYFEAVGWLAEFIAANDLGGLPVLDLGGGLAIAHTHGEPAPEVGAGVREIAAAVAAAVRRPWAAAARADPRAGQVDRGAGRGHALHGRGDQAGRVGHALCGGGRGHVRQPPGDALRRARTRRWWPIGPTRRPRRPPRWPESTARAATS